jgi:rod shape-determining protein MreD
LLAPAAGAIAATVLLGVPLRVGGAGLPEPVLPVGLAFAWAAIRPSVLGPVLLFLLGLFLDLFWGGRLGAWGAALICAYGLALSGRSLMAGQGAVVMGAWYAASCVLALCVVYLLATIGAHEEPNAFAVLWQLLWTIALFPAVYWLVYQFQDADVRFR